MAPVGDFDGVVEAGEVRLDDAVVPDAGFQALLREERRHLVDVADVFVVIRRRVAKFVAAQVEVAGAVAEGGRDFLGECLHEGEALRPGDVDFARGGVGVRRL